MEEQDYTPIPFPDFDKLPRLKQIELAKDGTVKLHKVLDAKATWKLYPFYWFTNFCIHKWIGKKLYEIPELTCDYCGGEACGNGEYYTHYIVFESLQSAKIACHPDCLPKGCMEYHDQQWGYREPVVFPKAWEGLLDMQVVFDSFVRPNKYQLRGYIGKSITEAVWSKEFISNNMDSKWGSFGPARHAVEFDGRKLTISKGIGEKPIVTLTRAQIIERINQILAKQPNDIVPAGTQLSLF